MMLAEGETSFLEPWLHQTLDEEPGGLKVGAANKREEQRQAHNRNQDPKAHEDVGTQKFSYEVPVWQQINKI